MSYILIWLFFGDFIKGRPQTYYKEEARSCVCDEAMIHESFQLLKETEPWMVKIFGGYSCIVIVSASIHHAGQKGRAQPRSLPSVPHASNGPVKVKVAQSCLTLCDPMDYIVHGILQARLLEWVPFPSPGDLPNPQGSNPGLSHCGQILYQLNHKGSPRILEWVAYSFSSGSS